MNVQKEKWNQFIIANNGSFLQSWEWGEFQSSLGGKIWRLSKGKELKALVIKRDLFLGKNYLYCPRGPISEITNKLQISNHNQHFELFLEEIEDISKKEKAIFLKIEPDARYQMPDIRYDFIKSQKTIQPSKTLILDITKPKEELLSRMHQKTRYNIKLAERRGIKVKTVDFEEEEEIEIFWQMLNQTARRDKFHLHPKIYYQKMLKFLGRSGLIKLFTAEYQGRIVAANLICLFGETAAYLHGVSDYRVRHLMAPHFLQWQTILEAKKLGLKFYDFWGIDEKKWPGLTRFKKGFGGREFVYPGAFDLPFQPGWYRLYNLARKILRG